jgi:hypothetical protein
MSYPQFLSACLAGLLFCINSDAAPLDALLSADSYQHPGEFHGEASYDAINATLDVAKMRSSTNYAGTNVGDYSGAHLRLGYALTSDWSVDGGFWKRAISYRTDQENISSWQVASQYRFYGDANSIESYALRVSGWGNRADTLSKSTPTAIMGRTLSSYSVKSPQDRQLQLDAIGTWHLNEEYATSAFFGLGNSHISTGDMTGTYTSGNGCNYNMNFTQTGIYGALATPCNAPFVITNFFTPQQALSEVNYAAHYHQLGASLQWKVDAWTTQFGYQYQQIARGSIDTLITSRGATSYQKNHIFVLDVSRKITPNIALFARGQLMQNQFVGEIPFAYNTATASKFSQKYGFASFGTHITF